MMNERTNEQGALDTLYCKTLCFWALFLTLGYDIHACEILRCERKSTARLNTVGCLGCDILRARHFLTYNDLDRRLSLRN